MTSEGHSLRRRRLLRRSAALGAVVLAGCSGDGDGTGGPGGTASPGGVTGLGDSDVETTATDCLGEDESAGVTFDADALSVTVEGTMRTPTPCYVARLGELDYDDGSDVVTVTIEAEETDGECVDCVGGVEYTATVAIEGALPGSVTVDHAVGEETRTVTTVER